MLQSAGYPVSGAVFLIFNDMLPSLIKHTQVYKESYESYLKKCT